MLDEEYVLFDFVPWGRALSKNWQQRDEKGFSLLYNAKGRPGSFDAHFKWLCNERRSRFEWVQTDLVAIRRDLVTHRVSRQMRMLARLYSTAVKGVSPFYVF